MAKIYVITGPAGVGKTTVTNHLAERLGKCAVLEGDDIYHHVRGAAKPWAEGNHLNLMWKNMLCLAENYLDDGIDVIMLSDGDFIYSTTVSQTIYCGDENSVTVISIPFGA